MIAFRLNLIYRPQDFSLGKLFKGQSIVDNEGAVDSANITVICDRIDERAASINGALAIATNPSAIKDLVRSCCTELEGAVNEDGGDAWRVIFPGKQLLQEYAKVCELGNPPVLENTLIKQLGSRPELVARELRQVVDRIIAGESFSS
jgi:hypothetical protein